MKVVKENLGFHKEQESKTRNATGIHLFWRNFAKLFQSGKILSSLPERGLVWGEMEGLLQPRNRNMFCVSSFANVHINTNHVSFENSPFGKVSNSSSSLEGQLVPVILAVVKIGTADVYIFLAVQTRV